MDDGKKSDKAVRFKCNLCDAQFKNQNEKVTHRRSPFHTFMVDIKQTQDSYVVNANTLNEQITESGKREPLIGLEYIYEYAEDSDGGRMYECKLCDSAFNTDLIFFHIVGIQHRVLYLAKHHPIMGIEAGFGVSQQAHYRKLTGNALAIERIHGRKKINVVDEVYVSKPDIYEFTDTGDFSKGKRKGKDKKSRRERKVRPRVRVRKPRSRDADDARSRLRGRVSQRDGVNLPKYPSHDPSQDFDARTLMRDSNPGSQNNSKDDAKGQQDATGSSAQPRIDGVPPFQPPSAGFLPVGPGLPLTAGVGPTAQDAYDDTDFRRRRGGPSAAGDPKDQNRRRNISPDPRYRLQRPGSRFDVGPGDIDVRSVLPLGGISFRELKTAHLRNIRAGGFSSNYVPLYDKKRKNKDTDSDMEVCDMEFSDIEPDEFWCNEELFDFLKSYYIGDDEDVQSVLESVKFLSEALVRHKSRKEDLQKRILEEKLSLEDDKKKFLELKKRKQDKIASKAMRSHEPENVNLFHQVTGTKKMSSTGPASAVQQSQADPQPAAGAQPTTTPVVQQAGQQPPAVTKTLTSYQQSLVSGIAPLLQQPVPRPQVRKAKPRQQEIVSEKPLMAGVGPLLQQLFVRPSAPQNVTQPPSVVGPRATLFPGTAPIAPLLGSDNRFKKKRPSRFDVGEPVGGAGTGLGAGPETRFNQNPQNPRSRFNNPYPSNQQARFPGQAAVRYPAPTNRNQPQQQGVQRPQGSETSFNQNQGIPASRFDNPQPQKDPNNFVEQGEGKYAESECTFSENDQFPGSWSDKSRSLEKTNPPSAGSETRFDQNPQKPASRFDNPSKEAGPVIGQRAGSYPGSDSRSNQSAQYPGSWSDKSASLDKTKPALGAGSDSRFNQNAQYPGSWSDKSGSLDKPKSLLGAGPDSRFNPNAQYPGSWSDKSASLEKTKSALGAGSDGRFNQSAQYPGSWSDKSVSLDKPKSLLGAGSDSRFKQNVQYSGSWGDNNASLDKTKPALGAGSDSRFNQNAQYPGSWGDKSASLDKTKPALGAGPDSRFKQNAQYPGSWGDNSASLDKTKAASGADLDPNYQQMQWNSGPQSGTQGFYNEPRPTSGMGAGRYGEQYNQNQWQSQFSSRGAYGSGMNRTPGSDGRFNQNAQYPGSWSDNSTSLDKQKSLLGPVPQGPQSMTSTGFSSDGRQGTWPSQDPPKASIFPKSILKNRTGNLP